jgi:hypothetical protein
MAEFEQDTRAIRSVHEAVLGVDEVVNEIGQASRGQRPAELALSRIATVHRVQLRDHVVNKV